MIRIWALLNCVSLVGCATSTTMPISADTVQITSSVAPACGSEGAAKVAVRQAAVETIQRGYDRFIIQGAAARSDVGVVGYTPAVAHTASHATAQGYGGYATATGYSTTHVTGGQPIIGGSHRQGLIVKMFKDGDPAGSNALSARSELGPKWKQVVESDRSITCLD